MTKQPSPIKLVTRTRDRWRNGAKPKSLEDNATALAYIIWQLALNAAKNLHIEDFHYRDDGQRTDVIAEYLAFLVHVTDRLVHGHLDLEQRTRFVSTAAAAAARHLQSNKEDILGRRDYKSPFLALLNERSQEYAQCSFEADYPGYPMLRAFGSHVQQVMGTDQTNKWVIDQVMEIDAPNAVDSLKKSMANLTGL